MVQQLSDTDFREAINNPVPIIVDFWASWCGPCQRLAPIFESIAPSYEGKLRFAKLNVEENQQAAQDNGVMSIPCLIVFKDGKEVDRITGAMGEEQLKAAIDQILSQV